MFEIVSYVVGISIAAFAACMIAFPEFFIPKASERKKRFYAEHWGAYRNLDVKQNSSKEESIEVQVPARKIKNVVGGTAYAGGRSISMRG